MRTPFVVSLAVAVVAGTVGITKAEFVIAHTGANDPTTEGFTFFSFGPTVTGPIPNDMGNPAWSIAATTLSSQFTYQSGLTAQQSNDIDSHGFVLTFEARAVTGLLFDPVGGATVAAAGVWTATRRFDVALGLDANGDTAVVLPTSIDINIFDVVTTPGPSYTLTGSGSTYHTYQLVYDPITALADLYVDGVLRLQDYGGHTDFLFPDGGLAWSAYSLGQANFSFVELASIPEPAAFLLVGLIALLSTAGHFAINSANTRSWLKRPAGTRHKLELPPSPNRRHSSSGH
jgi:hypothetical protein